MSLNDPAACPGDPPAGGEPAGSLALRVADAAPVLLAYVDANGRCRFANQAFNEWFGRDPAGCVGKTIADVMGKDAYAALRPYVEAALRGERVSFEQLVAYPNGPRHVHAAYVPDRDQNTGQMRGFVVIAQDRTAPKQVEDALRASENEIRYLTAHARCLLWHGTVEDTGLGSGAWAWNTQGLDEAGAQSFCPLDLRPGERYTNAWYRCRLPEGQALTDRVSVDALHADAPFYVAEFGCQTRAGEVRWFYEQVYAEPLVPRKTWRVVGVCTDITTRRASENALRVSLEENNRLLNEMRDAAKKQRAFLRDVLLSVTEGKLRLCGDSGDLPAALPPFGQLIAPLNAPALYALRHQTLKAARSCDLSPERSDDLILAVGEAAMNAVVHGSHNAKGAGVAAQVGASVDGGTVQVIVRDVGGGIDMSRLPRATLERGYSSAGTLGHGFWMILKTADRIFLLTGPSGTTVVIEQDRAAPAARDWD